MSSDWKPVLYEFIHRMNKLEIDETAEHISDIRDEQFLQFQRKRLDRLVEEHKERQVTRTKNELQLSLLDVKITDTVVNALCKMYRKLHYIQKGRPFLEERIEYAHVQLRRTQSSWTIANIETINGEAKPAPMKQPSTNGIEEPVVKRSSRPLLHPSIRNVSSERADRFRYDRESAGHYADTWWDFPNPEFIHFKVDCTNFVSQCLYAGGIPMDYTNRREQGWWYRGKHDQWSFSWSVAHSLYWYLANSQSKVRAELVDSPEQLEIGDCIFYDWDGSGRYGHSVIVAAKDADGMPLVNAHTVNSKHRYWDYKDSYAWSEHTRYAFFHID